MQRQVDIFIEQLFESNRESINITPRCRYLGLDTIGLLAFGYDLNVQRNQENRFILGGMFAGNYKSNCFFQFPLLYNLGVEKLLASISGRSRARFFDILSRMTRGRLAQGKSARKDLVSFVAESPEGASLDDAQLRELLLAEGLFFISAGGDTTATALCAFFFYISRQVNCEAYRKLSNEIRTAFSSAADIRSGPKLSSCLYLRACIDESL